MTNLLAARLQMAISLGFHILFSVVGIALPLLMVIAEAAWLRTKQPVYRELAKRWSKGAAILFAVGAVSGTVLSFELGLLWPKFMEIAGPIIGLAFGLEGFAFFTEAIFLGIYIYGWDRVSARAHWLSGVIVAFSGALSGVLVISANAWMNTPAGFQWIDGHAVNVNPISAMLNPMTLSEGLHMTLAAYAATGLMVAGIHALLLLGDRSSSFQRAALGIALAVGGVAAILQPLSGHLAGRTVGANQPTKLAALEGQWKTERRAPLRIGGIPDPVAHKTRYAIEIPGMLSWLAHGNINATVVGLDDVASDRRPNVVVCHIAFQLMVGLGTMMAGVAAVGAFLAWKKKGVPDSPWFLKLLVLTSPLGLVAVEAGWTVTEVGRQPWIIRGIMLTSEAVTPVGGLWFSMAGYSMIYLILGLIVVAMLRMQFRWTGSPDQHKS